MGASKLKSDEWRGSLAESGLQNVGIILVTPNAVGDVDTPCDDGVITLAANFHPIPKEEEGR